MTRRGSVLVVVSVGLALLAAGAVAWLGPRHRPVGLAAYLGWRDARTPELAAREARAVQTRIAACMAALGLPYREQVEPPPEVPDPGLGPREWAAKWGFGVSTSVGVTDALPPAADANLAYIDSLPPERRAAYRSALFGDGASRGCNGEANDAVYGRHDRLLAGLASRLAELEARIAADPRTLDADARWLSCVSSPSFRPSSRRAFGREAIDFVTGRLEAIMGPPPGRPPVDRSALADVQHFEIDLAVRGFDCGEGVRPLDDAVRLEYEARFVEEHRAALDDIKARAVELDVALGLASGE